MTCFIGLEITELAEKDMPIGKKKTPDYYLLRFKNWFIAFCFTRGLVIFISETLAVAVILSTILLNNTISFQIAFAAIDLKWFIND